MKVKRAVNDAIEVTDRIRHLLRFIGCSRVWFSKRLWERYVIVPEWVADENEGTRVWDIAVQSPSLRDRPFLEDGERFVQRYYVELYPNDPRAKEADGTPIPAGLWLESILTRDEGGEGASYQLVVLLVAELFPARVDGESLMR